VGEDLKKAIKDDDVRSFNRTLELARLLQDDNTMEEQLAATLCYAAEAGSISMMNAVIQMGVGKALSPMFLP